MDELTFYNSIHTGAEIDRGVTGGINALRIDAAPQALTEAEKKRVRERLGIQGNSFEIAGYFATLAALQAAVTNPAPGAAYGVGSAPPYNIYVWDGINEVWVNNGPISAEGISAYDYAVSGGYTGSETDFTQAMSQFPEHHTRHEAGGADEISITGAMIAPGSVTRVKLANDALYSPVVNVTTETYSLTAADYGKTLFINASGEDVVIDITEAFSESCPAGVEFAAFVFAANTVKIMFAGIRVFIAGEQQLGSATGSGAVLITQPSGMVGIKKLYSNPSYGDVWTITGNVEVVS